MRILVLGSTGQLGSQFFTPGLDVPPGMSFAGLDRAELDVARPDDVDRVLDRRDFDVLLNCTAYNRTSDAEDEPDTAFAVNAYAVRAMARACARKRARFVHVSTDYVFDGAKRTPYVETDCTGPLNVYGASKAVGERFALRHHDDVLVLRVASLFGTTRARRRPANFVDSIVRRAREGGPIEVVSDITMSPTGAADVAACFLRVLEAGVPPGVYHAANTGQATWHEFASAIVDRAGLQAEVLAVRAADFPSRIERPAYSVLSNRKLADRIGVIPEWTDALDRYLARAASHA